jgi:glyoxylase-like metal-dependent hydrolase (beta-lactamase superfamily II)
MFDTGMGGKGRLRQLDLALAQAGFGVEDVRLVVCTHSHTDHYGLAAGITEAAGCELWMHPRWEHVRLLADDPKAALEARIEVARQSGVPPKALERYREKREEDDEPGIDAIKEPDRDLVPGVEVETDLGTWQVHETPGHAPSHVVLHQPERQLLISGDHLLGRTVLFFDYGHSPDPVGEFLSSLEEVEGLDVGLVLPGHGRTFRDPEAKIAESRRQVDELLGKVRDALGSRERTAFEIVAEILGPENLNSPASAWVLQIVLSCLDHLAIAGEVEQIDGTDPQRWRLS